MSESVSHPPSPSATPVTGRGFHAMVKPIGPICNLDCKYCYYLEKEKLYPRNDRFRMPPEVLERYIREYIAAQPGPEVNFAWQGGEPTLLGVGFFEEVVALEKKYGDGRKITNALQTNGTRLDDAWGEFLAREGFLVGISIDGPPDLHNTWRVDKRGRDSSPEVLRGLEVLHKHGVETNTLTVLNRTNAAEPERVYDYLTRELGSKYLQFIPLVERKANTAARALELDLAPPPDPSRTAAKDEAEARVTPWSVLPSQFGEFLVRVFDRWVRRDVGQVFVQLFDVQLGHWMGSGPGLCVFAPTCGNAVAMEHNGDVYSCDHYVYPDFKLGNLMEAPLADLINQPRQVAFGDAKRDTLPRQCRECRYLFACHGECPKHRFIRSKHGEPGLNYLCEGYYRFFEHADPYFTAMARLIRQGRTASDIMPMVIEEDRRQAAAAPPNRNAPCPCGSGRKFKACCGKAATA